MTRFKLFHSGSKLISLSLSLCMLAGSGLADSVALAAGQDVLTGDVRLTVNPANLRESVPVPGANRKVTMSFRGVDVQDVLRALGQQGGFNVLLDESVTGTITVDLNNVTIADALDTIKTYSNLAYSVQGRNLMVAEADSEKGQSFKKNMTRIFPLRNANARVVADFLNTTVFADRANAAGGGGSTGGSSGGGGTAATGGGSSGGATPMPVTADYHTNSIIVVGDPTDIKAVQEHIEALDQPRQMKTWRLSQANALDVATILSSSLFNEGQPPITTTGTGGGTSGNTVGNTPSPLRVTAENIAEGTGASQSSQSSGSSGGGGSGSSSPLVNSLTLRTRVQQTQTIQISPTGPIILPDSRLNTITLMGTAEQISMAEALIPTLDRKVPQVVLEASLIEISEDGRKELGFSSASNNGFLSTGTNNSASTTLINRAFSNAIGSTTSTDTPLESLFRITSHPLHRSRDFLYQINALASKNKAKMLANPTVMTTSDSETLISIVDEVIRSVTVTQGAFGSPPTFTTNIVDVGIVLNILPKIGANNMVSLRVRPVISTVARTEQDRFGNVVTLLSKREALAQNVQLHDGETFIMGGLIHDTNTESIARNPLLSSLPIVGALGRNSTNSKHRSELVIMITPHIVKDDAQVATSAHGTGAGSQVMTAGRSKGQSSSGIIPVSFSENTAGNALPALEKPRVIGGSSYMSDPLEGKPLASPSPKPSGALLPDDSLLPNKMGAPKAKTMKVKPDAKMSLKPPASDMFAPEVNAMPSTSTTRPVVRRSGNVATEPDTSDEAIQAIINRYK